MAEIACKKALSLFHCTGIALKNHETRERHENFYRLFLCVSWFENSLLLKRFHRKPGGDVFDFILHQQFLRAEFLR